MIHTFCYIILLRCISNHMMHGNPLNLSKLIKLRPTEFQTIINSQPLDLLPNLILHWCLEVLESTTLMIHFEYPGHPWIIINQWHKLHVTPQKLHTSRPPTVILRFLVPYMLWNSLKIEPLPSGRVWLL